MTLLKVPVGKGKFYPRRETPNVQKTNDLISKQRIYIRRKQINKTISFFIIYRSIHGITILAIAYLLGVEVRDLKEFRVFGFQLYILILPIVSLIIIRRFYKIYKWWNNEEDIIHSLFCRNSIDKYRTYKRLSGIPLNTAYKPKAHIIAQAIIFTLKGIPFPER